MKLLNYSTIKIIIATPAHQSCVIPGWLAQQGVTDVIAGGIGSHALQLLAGHNITVNTGAQHKRPTELVDDWLRHTLVTGSNTCDH